jgi:putative restriction endonuclease
MIKMEQSLWVLKSVEDADRALQTVDHYDDKLSSVYNYDSKVPNFKQIKEGDNIILINKEKILGFATIEKIIESNGVKTIRKCPTCGSSTIDPRKNTLPKFRCNKGHTFAKPDEKLVQVKQFSAHYQTSFRIAAGSKVLLKDLRPYYKNGYNQNMSMQLMDSEALNILFVGITLFQKPGNILSLTNASEASGGDTYQNNDLDGRAIAFRQIKERRGQQKFRLDLFERYGAKCMITGSEIMDILEAAHINPYRGINDNHAANGLILRADIHTLFDLNLMGIDPDTLTVHFHLKTAGEYEHYNAKTLKCLKKQYPSRAALNTRWQIFKEGQ